MKVICIVLAVLLVGTIVGGCLQHEAYGKASWHNGFTEGEKAGQQTGYTEGYRVGQEEGYKEGYKVGMDEWYQKGIKEAENRLNPEIDKLKIKLGSAAGLRNPTYQELMDFLRRDKTENNVYDIPDYRIFYSAVDLNNSAEKAGIRAGFVRLVLEDSHGWRLVAFETTDQGLVFVDPFTDDIFTELVVGRDFKQRNWSRAYKIRWFTIAW